MQGKRRRRAPLYKKAASRKFTEEALILSKFFTSRKIFDNVTQIGGLGGELCYLIEGSEKRCLLMVLQA